MDASLLATMRGTGAGIEARAWLIDDSDDDLARTLRDASPPAGASAEALERWRASGLRVVSLPAGELETWLARSSLSGALSRDWLGLSPGWMTLTTGPVSTEDVTLWSGRLNLDSGRPRLLLRSWVRPASAALEPVLRVELLPELLLPDRRTARERLLEGVVGPAGDDVSRGVAMDSLKLGIEPAPGRVIVIVAEEPGVAWDSVSRVRRGELAGDEPQQVRAGDDDVVGPMPLPELSFGPPEPQDRTFGEVLLGATVGPFGTSTSRRAVIALVPRMPADTGSAGR
ncbi:MAG: hypothetical protein AAF747_04815 [Planctomycetota bacterium]